MKTILLLLLASQAHAVLINGNQINSATQITISSVTATGNGFKGNGSAITALTPANISAGAIPATVYVSSIQTGSYENVRVGTSTLSTKATALAATPSSCSAGNFPLGVDAQGNAQSCTPVGTIGGSGTAGIPAYFSAGTTIGNAPTGAIVKTSVVRSCTQACASTNVIAPSNSALAYNTGTSGMTGSYTPTSASNKVRVTVNAVLGSYSYGTYLILSDDTATTLLGITGSSPTNQQDALMSVSLKSADLNGWSGSHTFDVRYGVDATTNWSCFNAAYTNQTFGGGSQVCSTITFEEIAP